MKHRNIIYASIAILTGAALSTQDVSAITFEQSSRDGLHSLAQSVLDQNINYYCYQISSSGRVENLEHLCGDIETPPEPPPPPVILSDGNLECSFQGSISSSSFAGTEETISIPAVCIALRTTNNAAVTAQLKSGNRILGTHVEQINYIEAGETYAYDAIFTSDYASSPGESISIRFIP